MLPRVSNALTKSISPIGTSIGQQFNPVHWKPSSEKKSNKPKLKLVSPSNNNNNESTDSPPTPQSSNVEITAFIGLLDLLGRKDHSVSSQLGISLYGVTLQNQKKIGKSLKGAILDTLI